MNAKSLYVRCGHSHSLVLQLYERSHVDLHLAKLLAEDHYGGILVVKPLEKDHVDLKRGAKILECGHVAIHDAKILELGHVETHVAKLLGRSRGGTRDAKLLEEDHGCLNLAHLEVLKYSSHEHEGLRHVVLGFDDFLMHFESWSADRWSE